MNQQLYNLVSGLLFSAVALAHLYRAVTGGAFVVGAVDFPVWASWVAVVVAGFLGFTALRPRSDDNSS